jgi:TorA maturation chaperone TorD
MEKLIQLLETSQALNKVLGRIYLKEADQPLLDVLGKIEWTEDKESPAFAAQEKLKKYLAAAGGQTLEDLAVDYARVFLGAGITEEKSAYPFESVYTSPQGLICQDAYEDALRTYRRYGLARSQNDLYEDHIGLELEFLGFLDGKALEAARKNDEAEVEKLLTEKKSFIDKHILNWLAGFVKDIETASQTDFYCCAGAITAAVVEEEAQLLNDVLNG